MRNFSILFLLICNSAAAVFAQDFPSAYEHKSLTFNDNLNSHFDVFQQTNVDRLKHYKVINANKKDIFGKAVNSFRPYINEKLCVIDFSIHKILPGNKLEPEYISMIDRNWSTERSSRSYSILKIMKNNIVDWKVIDKLYGRHVKVENFKIKEFESSMKHPWSKGMVKYLSTEGDSLMFVNNDKKKISNLRRWNLVCDNRQEYITTYEKTSENFRLFDICVCKK